VEGRGGGKRRENTSRTEFLQVPPLWQALEGGKRKLREGKKRKRRKEKGRDALLSCRSCTIQNPWRVVPDI